MTVQQTDKPLSMVELVAWAIGKTVRGGRSEATYITPQTLLMARAAIEALREPTEAMRAAWDKDWQAWLDHHIEDDDHLYRVMIDAALSEGAER